MNPRSLRLIQQMLAGALAIVLAAVVGVLFFRVVREREPAVAVATTTTTTTIGTAPGNATTTTIGGQPVSTTTTTTIASSFTCDAPVPAEAEGVTLLRVYFGCGPVDQPPQGTTYVVRAVPETKQVLTSTLNLLLGGPTQDEQAVGFHSTFSATTAGALRGLSINEGAAVIDLDEVVLADATGTASSRAHFLADLNANVFNFSTIESVEYRIGGSCAAFWEALDSDGCQIVTREEWVNR